MQELLPRGGGKYYDEGSDLVRVGRVVQELHTLTMCRQCDAAVMTGVDKCLDDPAVS